MKAYIIYGLFALVGCSSLTPIEKGKLIKGNLDASAAGCVVYKGDTTIPRDVRTEMYCQKLLGECPAITIKDEVRKISQ